MTLPRRAEAPPSGVPTWARVGAKVICIDANVNKPNHILPACATDPIINGIYEIDWVGYDALDDMPCIGFIECARDACWDIPSFRPLISKSQSEDIAEFRKLLTGQPVRENERA